MGRICLWTERLLRHNTARNNFGPLKFGCTPLFDFGPPEFGPPIYENPVHQPTNRSKDLGISSLFLMSLWNSAPNSSLIRFLIRALIQCSNFAASLMSPRVPSHVLPCPVTCPPTSRQMSSHVSSHVLPRFVTCPSRGFTGGSGRRPSRPITGGWTSPIRGGRR